MLRPRQSQCSRCHLCSLWPVVASGRPASWPVAESSAMPAEAHVLPRSSPRLHPAISIPPLQLCLCPPTDLPLSLPVLRGGVKLDFRIKNNAGRPVRQQASRQVTGNPVTSQPDSKQTVNMPTCPCEQQIRVLRCCENRNQNQSSVFPLCNQQPCSVSSIFFGCY